MKIVEDKIVYDEVEKKVKVSYPWTQEVFNLSDNLRQAAKVQGSVERRLLKNESHLKAYNGEFEKFLERGVISRVSQEEIDNYTGPVSYVTHLPVHKPDSTSTPLRIVTNTSFVNENSGKSPNNCMMEGPFHPCWRL